MKISEFLPEVSSAPDHSHRMYSPRVFSRAGLVCPHCQARVRDPSDHCPRCDFEIARCRKAFPFAAPPLALVIDPSGLLPATIERDLQGTYQKLRKRFPQVDVSFCFVRLAAGVATQEFAFWLHNSAPAAGIDRAWQVLVVGDLTSGHLAFTVGYALEPFIKADQWEAALQELAACIADDQWKEGLNGFLVDARDLLTLAWSAAEQKRQRVRKHVERRRRERREEPNELPRKAEHRPDHRSALPENPEPRSEPVAVEDAAKS